MIISVVYVNSNRQFLVYETLAKNVPQCSLCVSEGLHLVIILIFWLQICVKVVVSVFEGAVLW